MDNFCEGDIVGLEKSSMTVRFAPNFCRSPPLELTEIIDNIPSGQRLNIFWPRNLRSPDRLTSRTSGGEPNSP
jgi:hypothetical protein